MHPAPAAIHSPADATVLRHARLAAGHAERVSLTLTRLHQAAATHAPRIVLATSLGAEGMVLTDMIARHGLPIAVATIDAGEWPDEALALVPRIESHYGITIERWAPVAAAVADLKARQGERSMHASVGQRQACRTLHEHEPLARMLEGRRAWVTGRRNGPRASPAEILPLEHDDTGRVRFNPLAEWSEADVWQYLAGHGVPSNTLRAALPAGMGGAPRMSAASPGDGPRTGRWPWEQGSAPGCELQGPPRLAAQPMPA